MSIWTHVACVARLDSIRLSNEIPDFDNLFGKECLFHSSLEVWNDAEKHPDAYLPMGSEGSLMKSVWINPDKSHIAAYTVSIFGDLRDHYSAEEIVKWFQGKCKQVEQYHCFIRQAVITVNNELNGTVSWVYEDDDE